MKYKKPTVTIGIPAYNEESNIGILLIRLLKQNQKSFNLDKIIVLSDGSTDSTVDIVSLINSSKIKLINQKERAGVNQAQNIVKKNTKSDILVLINADVIPADQFFLGSLIEPIIKNNASLVGANTDSLRGVNLIEKVLSFSHRFKQDLAENISLDNVYLCRGVARAFSKKLYSKIKWPDNCPEDSYSYFFSRTSSLKFAYKKNAVVYFRSPRSLQEQARQTGRFIKGQETLQKIFPKMDIRKEYVIPMVLLIKMLSKYFFINPIFLLGYLAICVYVRFIKVTRPVHESRYEVIHGSKKLIDYV